MKPVHRTCARQYECIGRCGQEAAHERNSRPRAVVSIAVIAITGALLVVLGACELPTPDDPIIEAHRRPERPDPEIPTPPNPPTPPTPQCGNPVARSPDIVGSASSDFPTSAVRPVELLPGSAKDLSAIFESTPASVVQHISTTADNQILVALSAEPTNPPNLFDLNEKTLHFQQDSQGRYIRDILPVAWEEDIGTMVRDDSMIDAPGNSFSFAGKTWKYFFLNPHGLISFGARLSYSFDGSATLIGPEGRIVDNRFDSMQEIADKAIGIPTISPLYKPRIRGSTYVRQWPGRVVVTWASTEPRYYEHGIPPDRPSCIQAVLASDGSIRFSYADVSFGDGIVGIFPHGRLLSPTDLSQNERQFPGHGHEVFRYRSRPNLREIACQIVASLGDQFDLLIFHSEFRVDLQEPLSQWSGRAADVSGIGISFGSRPCGALRLKGHWVHPVWIRSSGVVNDHPDRAPETRFDQGLHLFAHEFTHTWTAYLSYYSSGQVEPLFGNWCRCHWRYELHAPAAFPWHQSEGVSVMGGRYWQERADGTFEELVIRFGGFGGDGFSWLDLYAMGLAEASEVPDMFILRNLRGMNGIGYTGEKEVVTIEQVLAASGPRIPSARDAQRDFNAGLVYLYEAGREPNPEFIRLHREYGDKVIEYWNHITGNRSRMTTAVRHVP